MSISALCDGQILRYATLIVIGSFLFGPWEQIVAVAKILITWELGGGLGHIVPLVPIANALADHGHSVTMALKDVSRMPADSVRQSVRYVAAPVLFDPLLGSNSPARTFVDVLYSSGFGSCQALRAVTECWRHLFDLLEPDFLLCDHSPTALLASRSLSIPKAVIGAGFWCPPRGAFTENFLPELGPGRFNNEELTRKSLANANAVLARLKAPLLDSLPQLYEAVDETFLTTYQEVDHFPNRPKANYRGAIQSAGGKPVVWPANPYPRVFAYLKNIPALAGLLRFSRRSQLSMLVFAPGAPKQLLDQAACDHLHVLTEPVDTRQAAAECDLGITNANHGSTCDFLMAGKPVLAIPLFVEQELIARRLHEQGLGLNAAANDLDEIIPGLMRLLRATEFRAAATEFGRRYARLPSKTVVAGIVDSIEHSLDR